MQPRGLTGTGRRSAWCRWLGRGNCCWAIWWWYNRFIACKGDVQLTVLRQIKGTPDSLSKLLVALPPRFDLKAEGAVVKIHIHDRRGIGPALRCQGLLPIRQIFIAELTMCFFPASESDHQPMSVPRTQVGWFVHAPGIRLHAYDFLHGDSKLLS